MQDHEPSTRRLPMGVVAGISVLILATGSAVAWWGWSTISRNASAPTATQRSESPPVEEPKFPPRVSEPTETGQPQPKPAPAGTEKTLQVYWIKGSGGEIELAPVPVKLSSTGDSGSLLKAATEQLLAGPANSTVVTTIPRDTQLRSFAVRDDGVHIDLSKEFTTGGGTASMTARVAQILYTATSLNPNAQVWLSVEGEPLKTLGGEGLLIEQPLTRKSFEQEFSF